MEVFASNLSRTSMHIIQMSKFLENTLEYTCFRTIEVSIFLENVTHPVFLSFECT